MSVRRQSLPESELEPGDRRFSWRAVFRDWDLDFVVYGGLGLALLFYIAFEIGRAAWQSGSALAFGLFAALVGVSAFSIIRDVRRRILSGPTKLFLALWFVCVAAIVIVEFASF